VTHEAQTLIPHDDWQQMAAHHLERARSWTTPYRERRGRRVSHPIQDFLFTYYSYSLGRLESWHPSIHQRLELKNTKLPKHFSEKYYSKSRQHIQLDLNKLSSDRRSSFKWILQLLEATKDRAPIFGCYGMHEWAMVYQGVDIRHSESAPLRLSQEETDAFVESRPIVCSHYDAFRFFTPNAAPLNKLQPQKSCRESYEQPACVHANMDLYKWAYKCMPWVGSELLWECFRLALEMRELDMRAAPYDLSKWNCTPIKVERKEGREQYEHEQRRLAEKAAKVRDKLIISLSEILNPAA